MLSICQYTTVICFIYQIVSLKSISIKMLDSGVPAHTTGRSDKFSTIQVAETLEETVNQDSQPSGVYKRLQLERTSGTEILPDTRI